MDPEGRPEVEPLEATSADAPAGGLRQRITGRGPGAQRRARAALATRRARRSACSSRACAPSTARAEQLKGDRPRVPRQRGDGDHRPVGLRQVDADPLHQPHARGDPRRPRRGPGAARGRRRVRPVRRRGGGAPRDRHGLPEAQPVPHDVGLRQRRRRPAAELAPRRERPATRRSRRRCAARACGRRSPTASASPASGSPAASSSGCASRARWPWTPR